MGFCFSIKRLIKKISRIGVKIDIIGARIDILRESVYDEVDDLHTILESQQKLLLAIKHLLSKPGLMSLLVLKEVTTVSTREFICALALPALAAADTVSRKLIIQKLGEPSEPTEYIIVEPELSSLRSPEFQFSNKQKFTATLTSKDSDGNENEPRTQEFVVIDSIAPPVDGEMGVLVLREIEVPLLLPIEDPIEEQQSTNSPKKAATVKRT